MILYDIIRASLLEIVITPRRSMQKSIRNIAVIAHVDHGKTTLVDAILKQTEVFGEHQSQMQEERIMDTNDLERERGITILAKNCAVEYEGVKINIIDTPGHADFSGEVERTLSMADGALLIVDAAEGPMPQTRSVLKQALELGMKVIVVINKVDKKFADVARTETQVENLFLELASNDEQLEFPVLYGVGRNGVVRVENGDMSVGDVQPLLSTIVEMIPAASGDTTEPVKLLVSSMEYDAHVGRIAVGRLRQGVVKKGARLFTLPGVQEFGVEHLYIYDGLGRSEVAEASAGEIVAITGVKGLQIGMTIAENKLVEPYPAPLIGEPTLHMTIGANTSPMVGREGKSVTSRQIEERLNKELESNLSLRVSKLGTGKYRVSGRGELHLSILLETMRREGFEMEVGKPEVITKSEDGVKKEPYEMVEIVIPSEYEGAIHQELGKRLAEVKEVSPAGESEIRMKFVMPTRATLGMRAELLTLTRGTLVYASEFLDYRAYGKELPRLRSGVLVASHSGQALAYGLHAAQERGETFVDAGTEVYQGMIVGSTKKEQDIKINVTKGKQLTNMRSKGSDGVIQLAPPVTLSLEQSLDYLEPDELLEITPESLRLRKKELSKS